MEKKQIKKGNDGDTSDFAKKADLGSLNLNADEVDIDKSS